MGTRFDCCCEYLLTVDSPPSGDVVVEVDSAAAVVLSTDVPMVTVQFSVQDVEQCVNGQRYALSYEYTGSDAYTVLGTTRGTVSLVIADST